MVVKLYISGISGNKEVKKKQQRVQMILDSKQISYEAIDITEPGKEKDKEFMQQNGKVRESLGKYPLPPQIFNDDDFCGDYEDFDLANEVDELEKFLHIETSSKDSETNSKQGEDTKNKSGKFSLSKQHSANSIYNPYEYQTFKIKYSSVNGLHKQNIQNNDLAAENEQNQEVPKSEVNGETEAAPPLNPSFENIIEKVDISAEEITPEKEESSALESTPNDENREKGNEENVEDNEKYEVKGEAAEREEEKGDGENPEEDKVDNPNEEKSPPLEETETNDDDEDKGEKESEEGNESGNESPQSEVEELKEKIVNRKRNNKKITTPRCGRFVRPSEDFSSFSTKLTLSSAFMIIAVNKILQPSQESTLLLENKFSQIEMQNFYETHKIRLSGARTRKSKTKSDPQNLHF